MDQSLDELRGVIDDVDAQIVALLNKRYQAVRAVGEYKKAHRLPVFDPEREQRLMQRLNSLNQGPMTPEILRAVYREIIANARNLEHAGDPQSDTIYLDHAAAAPLLPEILPALPDVWSDNFANPESAHTLGSRERKKLQTAAEELFRAILPHVPEEAAVVWGGGASELIAAIAPALGDRHRSVWASVLDHPAARAMQKRGFAEVHSMPIDRHAGLEPLTDMGEPPPALGFFTWVQSETGRILDLERLAEFRALFPEAVLVLDAVQGAGKLAYPAKAVLPDIMIVSGHKFGAPGGGALLFPTRRGRQLAERFRALREPEYQKNRPEPATAILLALAAKTVCEKRESSRERVTQLAQFLRESLQDKLLPNGKKLRITLPADVSSPYILHLQLPGYQSGVLVRMLAEKGIMVSAGSACQSETDQPSAILSAMKLSREVIWSGLRISLSADNTEAELTLFVNTLGALLENY